MFWVQIFFGANLKLCNYFSKMDSNTSFFAMIEYGISVFTCVSNPFKMPGDLKLFFQKCFKLRCSKTLFLVNSWISKEICQKCSFNFCFLKMGQITHQVIYNILFKMFGFRYLLIISSQKMCSNTSFSCSDRVWYFCLHVFHIRCLLFS
uniref:Uncharacterized protein n=1 Tax=Panagrolaimus sp. ES5 TaxID=591445 RepID=A0AC34F7P1_9BILA